MLLRSLLLLVLCAPTVFAQHMNQGTNFWLCFDKNYREPVTSDQYYSSVDDVVLRVEVAASNDDQIHCVASDNSWRVDFEIKKGQVKVIEVPRRFEVLEAGLQGNKAIHLTSSHPCSVVGITRRFQSTESFSIFDCTELGQDYTLVGHAKLSDELCSQACVVATDDNTDLSVLLPQGISLRGIVTSNVHVHLNRGDVYRSVVDTKSEGTADFSGAIIHASKAVAVFSGSSLAYVPAYRNAGNPLVEQLRPTSFWGKTFITLPPTGRTSYSLKLVGAGEVSEISYQRGDGVEKLSLQPGSSVDIDNVRGVTTVHSSQPIQCFELTHGFKDVDSIGDPCMISLRPVEHYGTSCTFVPMDMHVPQDEVQNGTQNNSTTIRKTESSSHPVAMRKSSNSVPTMLEPSVTTAYTKPSVQQEQRDALQPAVSTLDHTKMQGFQLGGHTFAVVHAYQFALVCVPTDALQSLMTDNGEVVQLRHVVKVDDTYSVGEIVLDSLDSGLNVHCSKPFGAIQYGYPDEFDAYGHGL